MDHQRRSKLGRSQVAVESLFCASLFAVAPAVAACAGAPASDTITVRPPLEQVGRRAAPAVVQILAAGSDSLAQGSGFVVDPPGLILTHARAIQGARALFVRPLSGDIYYRARVVATDVRHQLAALEAEGAELPALRLSAADSVPSGARVAAVGGSAPPAAAVSTGIVGGTRLADGRYVLRLSRPLPSTASGGPVLGEDGAVLGILVSRVQAPANLTAAIPVAHTRELLAAARAGAAVPSAGQARPGVTGAAQAEAGAPGAAQPGRAGGPSAVQPGRPAAQEEDAPAADLTGWWDVVNTIEETSYAPFRGLRLGFRVFLRQEADTIIGQGRKWWENGRELGPAARSPIALEGTLEGSTLTATFVERGQRRDVTGLLHWTLSPDARRLAGSFRTTRGDSRGTSRAAKLP